MEGFGASVSSERGTERILVVDDEARLRKAVRSVLRRSGYEVEEAETGEQALERLTGEPGFQLVVLDNILPGYRGVDILRAIRSGPKTRSIAVLFLTGLEDRDAMVEALDEGADDYLLKPFDPETLLAKIRVHLRLRAQEAQLRREREEVERQKALLAKSCAELECTTVCLQASQRELLKANEELVAAKNEADAANKAKGQFLAHMSHEIRTPMNGVLGMIQLLRTTELDARQQKYVRTIWSSAESLMSIINDVLDFSRIEQGKVVLHPSEFVVRELVHDVVQLFAPAALRKRIAVSVVFQPSVPATLVGDSIRLRQILTNLVSNAVKYTAEGEIHVSVQQQDSDESRVLLRFSVEDTGQGIEEEARKALFAPFYQVGGTASVQAGAGLGLAICRGLAALLEGSIGVNTEPGKGSEFWFTARLARCRDLELADEDSGPPSERRLVLGGGTVAAPRPIYKEACVLVVEDNPVNQEVCVSLLESLGLQAQVESSGRAALEALSRRAYSLVLMDCQMPGMNGYDTTAEIRRLEGAQRRTPIVALTAHAVQGDREKCLAAGMDDYLSKPLLMHKLERIVQRWIGLATESGARTRCTASIPTSPTAIDPGALERIFAGNELLFNKVAAVFLDKVPVQIGDLQTAVDSERLEEVEERAHALRGAAASLGATRLEALGRRLECAAGRGDRLNARVLASELEQEFLRTKEALSNLRQRVSVEARVSGGGLE